MAAVGSSTPGYLPVRIKAGELFSATRRRKFLSSLNQRPTESGSLRHLLDEGFRHALFSSRLPADEVV